MRLLRSLRFRLTAVMLGASVGFGLSLLLFVEVESRRVLSEHSLDTARSALRAHERRVADAILVEDALELREMLQMLLRTRSRWRGVAATDPSGRILAVAAEGGSSPALLDAIHPRPAGNAPMELEGEVVRRVTWPLMGGRVGVLVALVGSREDEADARRQRDRLAAALAILTVAGVGAAFLFGSWLTEPLVQIAEAARRIGEGELGLEVEVPPGGAEVALLAASLNEMSRRLRGARDSLDAQRRRMVEVEKLAAVGTLAAGLAHEVANPMAGVQGCVRQLRRPDLAPERREQYADLALDGLDRGSRVLRDLLAYARAGEAGRPGEAAPDLLDLRDLVQSVVRLAGTAAHGGIRLAGGPDLQVRWPAGPVAQVITNLVLNAAQAAQGEVEVGWERRAGGVAIEVRDDGPGIPEGLRQRVFEPFFTTREPGAGTGLGLSVSRSIAEALGGSVELLPRDPRGTVARLVLPESC